MMFVSFYEFVPNELIEAAVVDGCSPLRTFIQIVFPLARNTVITIASMYSILIWNDFILQIHLLVILQPRQWQWD